jgi:Zn-dependent protease with chaperone function
MDRSDFSFLVARLERQAAASPGSYAFRVALLAALGYLALFVIAALILACVWLSWHELVTGGAFSIKLAILALVGAITLVGLVRALWVDLGEPDSLRLTRNEAPQLFETLDELRMKMGGVRLHAVYITNEFNASIMQVPRWGVFGNYRNHLEIGLPLAAALSTEELKAVLAHEMGHLSGSHGKFSAWIYRQRVTWHALSSKFEDPSNFFEQMLCAFYAWYAPYFYAYTFVLARSQEYEADRAAAAATSPGAVAASLTKTELIHRFLGEVFWKRLFDQVSRSPEPPYLPYANMARAIQIAEKEWARKDWLQEGLRNVSDDDDTHPSLSERLAALEVEPTLPSHRPERSALRLFEPVVLGVVRQFDDRWRRDTVKEWRARHAELKQNPEPARRAS